MRAVFFCCLLSGYVCCASCYELDQTDFCIAQTDHSVVLHKYHDVTEHGMNSTWIHSHGYWQGADVDPYHAFDSKLADALVHFFNSVGAHSIVDFGCGRGDYVKRLLEHSFDCQGYDGNPATPLLSNGICDVLDLSQPVYLPKSYDWVLSLEVGEHLPCEYETAFIENLDRHNHCGIVLSWAIPGQGGDGHFNEKSNKYIKKKMLEYGYDSDLKAEDFLRKSSTLPWFKNTIMVFKKIRSKVGFNQN